MRSLVDIFNELKNAAVQKNENGDFPDRLVAAVLEVANNPDLYDDQHGALELLLAQIRNYDTYAGAGCFDSSVTADTIERTLRLIRRR